MLKLSELCLNHHPSGVKLWAKKYQTWISGGSVLKCSAHLAGQINCMMENYL